MKMTNALLLACGLALASAPAVMAQTPDEPARGFVGVTGGFQMSSRTVNEIGTFPLYDETGSYTGARKIGNGVFFEIGGGVHITGQISAGIAYSHFSKSTNVPFSVVAPNPLFYSQPRTVALNVNDLGHSENAVHLQVLYQLFSSSRYDASIFVGPSIFSVKQDTVKTFNATESAAPFTTVTMAATFDSASKTAVGANAGLMLNYHLTGNVDAGLLVRYAGASAKMPSGSVKVGGPQVGVGLRYRF